MAANINVIRLMYPARNYIFDGMLPIALGFVAILATCGLVHLARIQNFLLATLAKLNSHYRGLVKTIALFSK